MVSQVWTTEAPTIEGWYWTRTSFGTVSGPYESTQVVNVYWWSNTNRWQVDSCAEDGIPLDKFIEDSVGLLEWGDKPIEEPQEQKRR